MKLSKLLLLLMLLFVLSCRKDGHIKSESEKGLTLNELKTWYKQQAASGKVKNTIFATFEPNWQTAQTKLVDGQNVTEVSSLMPNKVVMLLGEKTDAERDKVLNNTRVKLLFFNEPGSTKVMAAYMMARGNSDKNKDIRYKEFGTFSGLLTYYNFDGTFSNGYSFSSGKITNTIAKSVLPPNNIWNLNEKQTQTGNKQGDKLMLADASDCTVWQTDYYWETCVTIPAYPELGPYCSYEYSHSEIMIICQPNGGGGGGEGGYTGGGGGGRWGGGTQPPFTDPDESTEEADPDLKSDCSSWRYIPVGPEGNYQACGVSGIDLDYITSYVGGDGKSHIDYVYYKFSTPIYFEFPHKRANGDIINASYAATISATLRDEAEKRLEERLGSMSNPGGTVIENAYLEILRGFMAPYGGRISRISNYGTVPVSPLKKGLRGGSCNSIE